MLLKLHHPYRKTGDLEFSPAPELIDKVVALRGKVLDARVVATDGTKLALKVPIWGEQEGVTDRFLWFANGDAFEWRDNQKDRPKAPTEEDTEMQERLGYLRDHVIEIATSALNGRLAQKHGIVAAGGAGLGKTHTVETTLRELEPAWHEWACQFHWYEDGMRMWHKESGHLSARAFFDLIADWTLPGQVLVLDDCDIWHDDTGFQIMKAATEVTSVAHTPMGATLYPRLVSWLKAKTPETFETQASYVFIANEPLWQTKNKHIEAIKSRCYTQWFDFSSSARLRHMIATCRSSMDDPTKGLFASLPNITTEEVEEVIEFLEANQGKHLDFRIIKEIAHYRHSYSADWLKRSTMKLNQPTK